MSNKQPAEQVSTRLREVSRLRQQLYFSPTLVTRRLQRVAQLRRLCLELQKAGEEGGLRQTTGLQI